MSFGAALDQRVREIVAARPGVSERRMFGGLAFLLRGRMFVGIEGGSLMARVGLQRYQDALALPHWCAGLAATLPKKAPRRERMR